MSSVITINNTRFVGDLSKEGIKKGRQLQTYSICNKYFSIRFCHSLAGGLSDDDDKKGIISRLHYTSLEG